MAKAKIDVYKEWLKIEATNRPLNYYQLLRLKMFEDDLGKIRKHYQELNAHVRKYASGEYLEESQTLLNELAKAMLCLTDSVRKEDYDFRLGRKTETQTNQLGRRSFEDILLENRVLTPEQLKKSKQFSDAVGLDLEMAIMQQRHASQEAVMCAYAEAQGLPFVDLNEFPVDEYYVPQINPVMARQHSFIPVMSDMGKLILASPTPLSLDVEHDLQMLFNMPIKSAICTPAQVNAAIAKYYPRDAVQVFVNRDDKEESSSIAVTPEENKKQEKSDKKAKNEKVTKPAKSTKKASKQPLSKEAQDRRKRITLIAVNFSVMIVFFIKSFVMKLQRMNFFPKYILIILAVAVIVGFIAWTASSKEIEEYEDDEEDDEE